MRGSIMKQYTHLLFDVDNTILNFDRAEEVALARILQKYGPTLDQERLHDTYHKINRSMWQAYERGEMTREDLLNSRFFETFYIFDITVDGEALAAEYQAMLAEGHEAITGAAEMLHALCDIPKYVVSNGVGTTQYKRLEDSDMIQHFKAIYVSEDVGFHKPQIEFFEHVFTHSPEINRETTLIIGDSLTSDIQGGINAGIDTCWFNFYQEENTTSIVPTYTITSLDALLKLLPKLV